MKRLLLPLFAITLLSLASAPAQVVPLPGMDVAVVSVKPATAGNPYSPEFYLIDPALKKVHAITPPALVSKVGFNAVTAINPVSGYLTTIDGTTTASPASAGDLYRYIIAGSKLILTKLNTTAFTGGNLAQIAVIGSTVYVSTQTPAGTTGMIWSLPASGGAPAILVDYSKITTFGGGLVNGLTAMGGKIYAATGFGGTSTTDEVWEYDPVTKASTLIVQFTTGGLYTTMMYPVSCTVDTAQNLLVVVGLYRDMAFVDVKAKKTVKIINGGKYQTSASKPHYHQYLNAGVYNPYTGDIDEGSRVGNVDFIAGDYGTLDMIGGVGSSTTAANNSVTGMDVLPGKYVAHTFGNSGTGSPSTATYRFYPINLNMGVPQVGRTWGSRVFGGEGGVPSLFIIGLSKTSWMSLPLPFDLAPLGAKGNNIYCSLDVPIVAILTGTGNGKGEASISFPMPAPTLGMTFYTQWLVLEKTANTLGLVTSNGRTITVQ